MAFPFAYVEIPPERKATVISRHVAAAAELASTSLLKLARPKILNLVSRPWLLASGRAARTAGLSVLNQALAGSGLTFFNGRFGGGFTLILTAGFSFFFAVLARYVESWQQPIKMAACCKSDFTRLHFLPSFLGSGSFNSGPGVLSGFLNSAGTRRLRKGLRGR